MKKYTPGIFILGFTSLFWLLMHNIPAFIGFLMAAIGGVFAQFELDENEKKN